MSCATNERIPNELRGQKASAAEAAISSLVGSREPDAICFILYHCKRVIPSHDAKKSSSFASGGAASHYYYSALLCACPKFEARSSSPLPWPSSSSSHSERAYKMAAKPERRNDRCGARRSGKSWKGSALSEGGHGSGLTADLNSIRKRLNERSKLLVALRSCSQMGQQRPECSSRHRGCLSAGGIGIKDRHHSLVGRGIESN